MKLIILIVDGSRAMRRLIHRYRRQGGFTNVEVEDGVDTGAKFKSFLPHLVLSDWNMPNMNGIELLQALNKQYSNVNLGFITSQVMQKMKIRAQENDSLFFLSKPFTQEQSKWTLRPYLEG